MGDSQLPLPGSHYNLCVSYLDNISDKQKFFIFQIIVTIIYSGCSDMFCVYHYVHYMCCILCVFINVIT